MFIRVVGKTKPILSITTCEVMKKGKVVKMIGRNIGVGGFLKALRRSEDKDVPKHIKEAADVFRKSYKRLSKDVHSIVIELPKIPEIPYHGKMIRLPGGEVRIVFDRETFSKGARGIVPVDENGSIFKISKGPDYEKFALSLSF